MLPKSHKLKNNPNPDFELSNSNFGACTLELVVVKSLTWHLKSDV